MSAARRDPRADRRPDPAADDAIRGASGVVPRPSEPADARDALDRELRRMEVLHRRALVRGARTAGRGRRASGARA